MRVSEVILLLDRLYYFLFCEIIDEVTITRIINDINDIVAKDRVSKSICVFREIVQELAKEMNYQLLLKVVPIFLSISLQLLNKDQLVDFCHDNELLVLVEGKVLEVFCLKHNVEEEELVRLLILNTDFCEVIEILGLKGDVEDELVEVRMETMSLLRTCGYETLDTRLRMFLSYETEEHPENINFVLDFVDEYRISGSVKTFSELLRRELAKINVDQCRVLEIAGIFMKMNAELLRKKRWLQMIKVKLFIATLSHSSITYLRNDDVLRWIFFDTSFVKTTSSTAKERKKAEDTWGKEISRHLRKEKKQEEEVTMWTSFFGESIAKEIFLVHDFEVAKPKKKNGMEPDLLVSTEVDKFLVEVKTQTFFTSGTAGEKIIGVPLKYCRVKSTFKLPLKIMSIANAEKLMREKYLFLSESGVSNGLFAENILINRMIEEELGITFIGASDLLVALSDEKIPQLSEESFTTSVADDRRRNEKRIHLYGSKSLSNKTEQEVSSNLVIIDLNEEELPCRNVVIFDITEDQEDFDVDTVEY